MAKGIDIALDTLEEAKELLKKEQDNSGGNQDLAMTITKVDEAIMWREKDLIMNRKRG